MEGLRIEVDVQDGVSDKLSAAARVAKNPRKAAQASAEWMAGEVFRIFANGFNVSGPWQPLSKVTLFLRKHRANSPRQSDEPGSDTGRLKGSFTPSWEADGVKFGAGSNLDYAEQFDKGGESKYNTVAIAGFTRKLRDRQATAYARGKMLRLKGNKVRDYLMHMKAGHEIPPRQFFPQGMDELAEWGWTDKVREIFKIDFDAALGGAA